MIQNSVQIKNEVDKIQEIFMKLDEKSLNENEDTSSLALGQIQKLFSTTRYLYFSIRFMGKTAHLYLGRGKGHEGVWLGIKAPDDFLRINDAWLAYLRSSLKNAKVLSFDVDKKDRIFTMTYRQQGKLGCFALFWSGRLSYFLNAYDLEVFIPWKGEKRPLAENTDILSYFDEVGRKSLERIDKFKEIIPIEALLEKEQIELTKTVEHKKLKSLKNKKKKIEEDLKEASLWKEVTDAIKQDDFDLTEKKEFSYKTCLIKFKTQEGHYQKLDKIYSKIKKLKKGQSILEKRLEDVLKEIENLQNLSSSGKKVTDRSKIIKPVWASEKNQSKKIPTHSKNEKDIDEFKIVDSGIRFAVGKSAHGNDELRASWAAKEDWWFHLEQGHSAHIIVKTKDITSLGSEGLKIIASALGEYSKVEGLDLSLIPLIFTQVKNLKGVKGSPGKVIHKKTKHQMVQRDLNWQKKVC